MTTARLVRGDIYSNIDDFLAFWLINHPEFHKKLWYLELAYLETAYELRDHAWLSGQPLTEDIDQLIQASNAQVSSGAESDLISETREAGPGFLP